MQNFEPTVFISLIKIDLRQFPNKSKLILKENYWNPGVFIDIDGVVLQGGKPFEWSKQAIHV